MLLVGDELHYPPYDRPPLSKEALVGPPHAEPHRIKVVPDLDVEVRLGGAAVGLDLTRKVVLLDDDSSIEFDRVVVATGATARSHPLLAGRDRVFGIRRLADAVALRERLASDARVVVVGAGVLGCEVAASARKRGASVTVVDVAKAPMERVLGPEVSGVIAERHRSEGVDLRLGRQIVEVQSASTEHQLGLDDGSDLIADVVVVAIGGAPSTAWLAGSGLDVADGVGCDESGFAVGRDDVVAAGDVARWRHPVLHTQIRTEHWTGAAAQGRLVGENLAVSLSGGGEIKAMKALPYSWSEQFDWKLQIVGLPTGGSELVEGSVESGRFVFAYSSDGAVVGAVCVNSPNRLAFWRSRIQADARV